jgi:hypothetical protein
MARVMSNADALNLAAMNLPDLHKGTSKKKNLKTWIMVELTYVYIFLLL